jgi:hypothetical protein
MIYIETRDGKIYRGENVTRAVEDMKNAGIFTQELSISEYRTTVAKSMHKFYNEIVRADSDANFLEDMQETGQLNFFAAH